MQKTAVIVSGSLRQLVNASSSWQFDGDYFLIVDQDIQASQAGDVTGNSFDILKENLSNAHVKFVSTTVSIDNKMPEGFKLNSSANMIAKWRLALHQITAYAHEGYERVIILRPDLYLRKKSPTLELDAAVLKNDVIYSTVNITPKQGKLLPIMNDVLLICNMHTFTRFANELYWYYLENHKPLTELGYDVHAIMAKFVADRNFEVDNLLDRYFQFTILRDNSTDMFEHGVLKESFSFTDLVKRGTEWWKQKYE